MEDKKEFSEEEYEKIKGDKESFNKYHSSILQPLFYQVWDKLNRTFGLGEFSEEVRDLFSYVVLIDSINKEIINQDSGLDDKERNFHTIMKKIFEGVSGKLLNKLSAKEIKEIMKKIESNEKKIETSGVLKGDSDENNIRFFSPDRGLSEYNYKIFKNYFKKKITKKKK